jgi:two-component system cell cycle sensor histidine kinase/response regulator CckA
MSERFRTRVRAVRLQWEGRIAALLRRAAAGAAGPRRGAMGSDALTARVARRRVADHDLARRLLVGSELIDIAQPHLEWLSSEHPSVQHVVCLLDREGIVLCSTGTDTASIQLSAQPGCDRSDAMARAALVRGSGGEPVGAIELCASAEDGAASRLALVTHTAYAIGQELRYRESLTRATGELAAEQRLSDESARRLAAMEALRESEARFQGAFDHSTIGAAITSPAGDWLRVNRALCNLLGYSERELVGRNFQSLSHADDLEHNLALLRRALDGETDRYEMEKRLLHASGHFIWVRLNAALVRDAVGRPLYLIGQFQDVTERRRAEEQLRVSEERHRRVVEAAHEGICTVDVEGRITYANARLAHMLDCTNEALVGKTLFAFMTAEANFDARTRFARHQRGIAEIVDLELERADGTTLWVQKSVSSLFDPDGRFVGAVYLLTDVTARHAAQQQVAENERLFRALTEQSSELVCVLDAGATIRYANPAFVRLLGYAPDEMIGRCGFDFVEPGDAVRVTDVFGALATQPGGLVHVEYGVRHRDGTRRLVSAVAHNLIGDPAVAGVVVNAHDVTERRLAEDALRKTEARYHRIAANAPGMVYQFVQHPDGTYRVPFVSEGARDIYGLDPREIERAPASIIDVVHPDDRRAFDALIAASAANLSPWHWEGRVVLPSGEEKWLRGASRPERQPDGSTLWDGLLMDVTDRQLAARRLEESEQHYRSLFDQNPDAVFSFDTNGYFVSANVACERLTGCTREELVCLPFEPLVPPEHLDATVAGFRAALAGEATSYESAIHDADGSLVELAVTNIPIVVNDVVVGVFGIAKDLTGRRELEAQLRQAQKMEAVGRLAGGVAHDFNNILTVITAYTAMAIGELPSDAPICADLREVEAAANRAASLTRQLLAFSRQQVLQPRRIDVNRTVSDVVGMLRRVIGEDITLQTELAARVWPVHVDPGQLEQVLMNLAVNARDAMPSGGTLRLRSMNVAVDAAGARGREGLLPGEYAAIVVEDTGTGIDAKVLPQIFEPFYTTKEPGQGTGLGLATVYGIVKQSDGFVYVDSVPGKGSQFHVLLPRTEEAEEAAPGLPTVLPRGNETILLVEDESVVRVAARRMLERQGYAILEASNGAEALRVAAEADVRGARIELVLTDVVMPEQGGRALGDRLAMHWPTLRVLYMSGYTDDEILRRGLMKPGAAFLEKPFTAEQLARAVRRALDTPSVR